MHRSQPFLALLFAFAVGAVLWSMTAATRPAYAQTPIVVVPPPRCTTVFANPIQLGPGVAATPEGLPFGFSFIDGECIHVLPAAGGDGPPPIPFQWQITPFDFFGLGFFGGFFFGFGGIDPVTGLGF